jgi:hypothetical protein
MDGKDGMKGMTEENYATWERYLRFLSVFA